MIRTTSEADEQNARRRFRELDAEYDAIVEEARSYAARPSHGIYSRSPDASSAPDDPHHPRLTEADARQLATAYFARARLALDAKPPLVEPDEAWDRLLELDADAAALSDPDDPHALRWTQSVETGILSSAGLRGPRQSPEAALFHEFIRRALVQLVAIERKRATGDYSDEITDALFRVACNSGSREVRSSRADLSFEALITRYDKERIEPEEGLTPKTKAKNRAALSIIARYFGPTTPVSAADREAFLDFRLTLAKLPPNVTKLFSATATLQDIARQNEKAGGPRLKPETQTTYLRLANALLEFAKERRLIEHNEAQNLRAMGPKVRPQARRRPFSPAQLQKIFNAPIYTGCIDDERQFSKQGDVRPRRSRFWVPLLALFTGLRMEEILQLTPAHVQIAKDGLPFLLIASDMRVKTDNGYREVPVHQELVRIGFTTFISQRRKAGDTIPLFDDVPVASDGYRSSVFSKRFKTFSNSIDLREDGRPTTFHSFRHNFRDGLRQPSANPDFVREAGGWAANDTSSIYGDGTPAHMMRSLVDGIVYDVDLRHLHSQEEA